MADQQELYKMEATEGTAEFAARATMQDELNWLRELEQDAQAAWRECPYENWLLVRSKINNRIIALLEARTAAPDANCITLPDGDCVGSDCMHDSRVPLAGGRCPRNNGMGVQCAWGAGHNGRHTFEPDPDLRGHQ